MALKRRVSAAPDRLKLRVELIPKPLWDNYQLRELR
jgi:hypothetical protein